MAYDHFKITKEQSVALIVKTCLEEGVTDKKQIAYILSTAEHESMNFKAASEIDGRSQARKLGYGGGENYYGRGYVHITHIENYQQFDKLLGLNGQLAKKPEMAENPEIAAKILVIGMRDGLFRYDKHEHRHERLDHYVNDKQGDYYNARNTVNGGHDKARLIAGYAQKWEAQVPLLIEKIKTHGVDIHEVKAKAHTQAGGADAHSNTKHSAEPHHAAQLTATPKPHANNGVFDKGDRGDDVKHVQTMLASLGAKVGVDGIYGHETERAVKGYQMMNGLEADGIVGPKTMAALKEDAQRVPTQSAVAPVQVEPKYQGSPDKYVPQQTQAANAAQPELSNTAQGLIVDAKTHIQNWVAANGLQWNEQFNQAAHSIASAAHQQGFPGINMFAVNGGQIDFGHKEGFILKTGSVETAVASNTDISKSLQTMAEVDQKQSQTHSHTQQQAHTQTNERGMRMG
jgi:hypothetical protein